MKTMYPSRLPPTAAAIVEKLKTLGPSSAYVVADAVGLSVGRTKEHLRLGRNCGACAVTRNGGPAPLWYVAEHKARAELMEAEREAEQSDRKREQKNALKRKNAAKRKAEKELAAPDMPIAQTVVKAERAKRPEILGPASVFHLGAML